MAGKQVCFCDCHVHPGAYHCEPCGVCGHFHSEGQLVGGILDGWQKKPDAELLIKELENMHLPEEYKERLRKLADG